jgi:molybdate transport system ATP-binding protein
MIELRIKKKLHFAEGEGVLEVDEKIDDKQFLIIYGPSGAGKTSILRMIAGLTTPDEGSIIVNGITWFDKSRNINLQPQKRSIGFVFQDYALFPNMSVEQNLTYAKGFTGNNLIKELINFLSLDQLLNRKPEDLSGGQKQRVALARAIIRTPQELSCKVLLPIFIKSLI